MTKNNQGILLNHPGFVWWVFFGFQGFGQHIAVPKTSIRKPRILTLGIVVVSLSACCSRHVAKYFVDPRRGVEIFERKEDVWNKVILLMEEILHQ